MNEHTKQKTTRRIKKLNTTRKNKKTVEQTKTENYNDKLANY